jgi:hypothetical protein
MWNDKFEWVKKSRMGGDAYKRSYLRIFRQQKLVEEEK